MQGEDLVYELEIPAYDAVLGADVELPTLEGRARLHVPPGTQNGQRFRLSGKGLPGKGGQRGDFYAVASITVPKNPSATEKALWEQLAAASR